MADRYSRLYILPVDLYASGAPLVIAAGALLLDRQNDQVLAQLKMRSISAKTIGSVKILVTGKGEDGAELCRTEHQYTELSAGRDALFGAKEAVRLPDAAVRSFTVQVLAVSFADGSRYIGSGEPWQPLPAQSDLNQRLFDTELIRQYRLETSSMSRYVPMETQDLWLCACGEINHRGESCHRCGQSFEHCREYLSVERLRENKSLRLNAEAAQAALDEAKKQSRARLIRRILCVLLPILFIACASAGVYVYSSRRAAVYTVACEFLRIGEYAEAAIRFEKLGGYRDARELAARARKADAEIASYNRAGRLMENGRWDDAYEAYAELGDYEDSAELALEARYRKGLELIEQERGEEAREIFLWLGDYQDARSIAAHFFERLLSEELSMSEECGGPLTTSYRYDSRGRIREKTELFSAYEGMSDRVYTYRYDEDGSYSVTEGQVEKRYDAHDAYLGQGNLITYHYEYEYYPDGSVHFRIASDAQTGAYRGSVAYDEHGNLLGVQNEDGGGYAMLNEYEGDLLVKQERYNADGVMLSRASFDYGDDGKLKRATLITPGASAPVTAVYSYGLVYLADAEE